MRCSFLLFQMAKFGDPAFFRTQAPITLALAFLTLLETPPPIHFPPYRNLGSIQALFRLWVSLLGKGEVGGCHAPMGGSKNYPCWGKKGETIS